MNRLLHLFFFLLIFQSIGKATSKNTSLDSAPFDIQIDTVPPVIFCPPSQIINLAPMRCDTVITYTVSALDDQGQVSVMLLDGIASGEAFPAGATVCTYQATDLAGNTATCSFTITAQEPMTQPTCRNQTAVYLNTNCSKSLKAFEILVGGPYGCASNYITEVDKIDPLGNGPWVNATFTAADIDKDYQVRVTSLFTGATCIGNIMVLDSMPPVITLQNINVPCVIPLDQLSPTFLHDSLGLGAGEPMASDACSGIMPDLSFEDMLEDFPCDGLSTISGIIHRIWTATDAHGNSSTKEQIINRQRLLSNVQIPENTIVDCAVPDLGVGANGLPFIEFLGRQYELTPAFQCEFDVQSDDVIQPGNCAGNYTVQRSWTISDSCLPISGSNPKSGQQNIQVQDIAGPVIQCPADVVLSVTDLNCRATVDLPDVFLTDNCSALTSFQASWLDNGTPKTLIGSFQYNAGPSGDDTLGVIGVVPDFPIGTLNMHYAGVDQCGNTSDCFFNLTVANMTAPVVACDTFLLTGLPASGYLNVPALILDEGSTDDCSPLFFKAKLTETNTCNPESLWNDTIYVCCHNLGDTLAGVLRVYDIAMPLGTVDDNFGAGHFTDCNFQIKVTGSNPPKCTAPADISISCEAFDPTLESYGGVKSQSCSVDSILSTVNYSNFDTLCSRGTLTRNFTVFDNLGLMGQCSQKIVVDFTQHYYIQFPDDMVVTACDTTGFYGMPTYFGEECEFLNASYVDSRDYGDPNGCYKIERTWKIINWCTYDPNSPVIEVPNPNPIALATHPGNLIGPIVSPIEIVGDPWKATISKIAPTDMNTTNFATFFDENANGYEYTQLIYVEDMENPIFENCTADTLKVQDVSTNDPQLWNAPYWLDPLHLSFDLCEAPSTISITASDACAGKNVAIKYQLSLDLDNDGLRETIINSNNLPPANTVFFNNSGGAGVAQQFDFRPVSADQKWRFAKEEVISGNNKTAYVRFNTTAAPNAYWTPQLPYGSHKIKWFVTDECGNESICERILQVRDGMAPTVICQNNIIVNILPTKEITINADDFLQYHEDNCTPSSLLELGIRKMGSGSGFPLDGNGDAIDMVTFDCDELGVQLVELWSRDKSGNAGFCQTGAVVQDNSQNCIADPGPPVSGHITTAIDDGIEGVRVEVDAPNSPFDPTFYQSNFKFTDSLGFYDLGTQFNPIPVNGLFLLPAYDENPLNGLTTFDLVLISKHILGIEALDSPYKLIAADANNSKSITTFDIVEFRKLLLGIYLELPNNDSWRFVDKAYVFPNMQNPFQPPFPESILYGAAAHDFIGVKIGDVNNTAVANATAPADERSAGTSFLELSTNSREQLQSGEVFELRVRSAETLVGCQFTLNFNDLEVLDILPGDKVSREHFALFPEKNALTMAWEQGGIADFTLSCKALAPGNLREKISIGSNITKAEAYIATGEKQVERFDLGLRFPEMGTFELFQNHPNPFAEATDIIFNLPEASEATLKVFDTRGRVIFTQSGYFDRGTQHISLEKSAFDATGILFYQVETPRYSATRKMLKI